MQRARRAFIDALLGAARMRITEDSPARLAILYGTSLTVFNRQTGQILQDSKLVATFPTVALIELQQVQRARDSLRWEIGLRLCDGRILKVGQLGEPEEASIVAAHIGTATGKPVSVSPVLR